MGLSAAERKSRRARKGRAPVKVNSDNTIRELKLKLYEIMGIHPKNQRLYARAQLLQPDELSLAQAEVFPDEEIRLVHSGEHPDDDISSLFDGASGAWSVCSGLEPCAVLSIVCQPCICVCSGSVTCQHAYANAVNGSCRSSSDGVFYYCQDTLVAVARLAVACAP